MKSESWRGVAQIVNKREDTEIYNAGVKAYNGRAQRVLQALGLAEWEMEMAPHADGKYTMHLTVWLTPAGTALAEQMKGM